MKRKKMLLLSSSMISVPVLALPLVTTTVSNQVAQQEKIINNEISKVSDRSTSLKETQNNDVNTSLTNMQELDSKEKNAKAVRRQWNTWWIVTIICIIAVIIPLLIIYDVILIRKLARAKKILKEYSWTL